MLVNMSVFHYPQTNFIDGAFALQILILQSFDHGYLWDFNITCPYVMRMSSMAILGETLHYFDAFPFFFRNNVMSP